MLSSWLENDTLTGLTRPGFEAHGTNGPQLVHQKACPVCGKLQIKDPLLLIGKSSLCRDGRFPLKKYVRMNICLMSNSQGYENQCALETSLNKTSFTFRNPWSSYIDAQLI